MTENQPQSPIVSDAEYFAYLRDKGTDDILIVDDHNIILFRRYPVAEWDRYSKRWHNRYGPARRVVNTATLMTLTPDGVVERTVKMRDQRKSSRARAVAELLSAHNNTPA